jgi:hypothetical protein
MSKIGKVAATVGTAALAAVAVSSIPTSSVQAVQGEIWTTPPDGQDYLWGVDPVVTSFGTTNTDTASWSSPGDGWTYLLGTDIKVKIDGKVLTITGAGKLPDYNMTTLSLRPWAASKVNTVIIDDAVTYVGSYSFYGMDSIESISIGSRTFINDNTCFEGIADNPTINVRGTETTKRQYGKITLTSLDSIKRMQSMSEQITIVSPNLPDTYNITAKCCVPSNECYEAYAAFIGDYNFATTFGIELTDGDKLIGTTDGKIKYTLTIPTEFVEKERNFKLLAIGSGYVYTYDDLDDDDSTITFETDMPTTWYALVYE